jgi:hypothetical protein
VRIGFPRLPETNEAPRLALALTEYLRRLSRKVDEMAYGRIAEMDSAAPTPPVAGTWARGDFVRNSQPTQLGTAGSRYIVLGWSRLTNGSANALNTDWFEVRALTGN